jgi:hypothetical protein
MTSDIIQELPNECTNTEYQEDEWEECIWEFSDSEWYLSVEEDFDYTIIFCHEYLDESSGLLWNCDGNSWCWHYREDSN